MSEFNYEDILGVIDCLESFAMDFRAQLNDQGLIQNRRFGLATYPDAFLGNEAVSVLVELLQDLVEETPGYEDHVVAREEALVVGQKIAERFQLFESAFVLKSMDHELSDDAFQFYKIKHNLPADVANSTNGMMLADYVKVIKRDVAVADRAYRLRMYRSCFVGSEAVDLMMKKCLCVSREEAVKLIRKLNKRFSCFKHVCDSKRNFEDGLYYYRFKWDQEKLDRVGDGQTNKVSAINCAIDALTGNEDPTTEFKLTSEHSFYHN